MKEKREERGEERRGGRKKRGETDTGKTLTGGRGTRNSLERDSLNHSGKGTIVLDYWSYWTLLPLYRKIGNLQVQFYGCPFPFLIFHLPSDIFPLVSDIILKLVITQLLYLIGRSCTPESVGMTGLMEV